VKRIIHHVEACVDVLEIVEYYEEQEHPELADEFTSELENIIAKLARPLAGGI
jgi:plasmid stabilization system protein ParE